MELEKVLQLLAALDANRVDYVVVGGVAVNFHGIIRATEDVDLFIKPDDENVERLKRAIASVFNDPSIEEISASDLCGEYPTVRYIPPDDTLMVDVISRLGEAVGWDDLEWETMEIDGIPVRVATPRCLVRMKRGTIRAKDRADAETLRSRFEIEDE